MSMDAINWALTVNCVSSTVRHVLLVMANYTNASNRCHLSVGRLVRETGISERTVRRALEQLRSTQLITMLQPAHAIQPATYSLALKGGHHDTPQPQSTPVTVTPQACHGDRGRGAIDDRRGVTMAPNPISHMKPPTAGTRASPPGALPAPTPKPPDQETKPVPISQAERDAFKAQLRQTANRPFDRPPSKPMPKAAPTTPEALEANRRKALDAIERMQRERLQRNQDTVSPTTVSISASSPADERSKSADER